MASQHIAHDKRNDIYEKRNVFCPAFDLMGAYLFQRGRGVDVAIINVSSGIFGIKASKRYFVTEHLGYIFLFKFK